MKLPCKVIEDMLPMYYDKVCSEESAALVEEHLKDCPCCSRMLADLGADMDIPEQVVDDIKPLKKLQKSYKKIWIRWIVAILCVLALIPVAFFVGNDYADQKEEYAVEYTKEEALAHANAFMTCLVEKDYAKAYSYWDVEGRKQDLLSGDLFMEEDLLNFEADGLKKFCEGGEKLETWGGIKSYQLSEITGPGYFNSYGTEDYFISYIINFDGKEESFGISLTKEGIGHISSGDGLIKHPLSHLTLWVQWVVDDYKGQYYDFDSGKWVDHSDPAQ